MTVEHATVRAERVSSDILRVPTCIFCQKIHFHRADGPTFRTANCRQVDLPEELRGKTLRYRLRVCAPLPRSIDDEDEVT